MKRIMHMMRTCSIVMAFLVAFTMLSGLGFQAQAADDAGEAYDGTASGSITVELSEQGGNRENVEIRLYKVGTLDTSKGYLWFELENALENVESVDLNDITTGEANTAAAQKLLAALQDNGTEPVSQWTSEEGKTTFSGLEQGMYLIAEGSPNAYGVFTPLLVPVPLADETHWDYNPVVSPKADGEVSTLGRIDVTKKLKGTNADGNLQDVGTDNATYYIGLFMDANGEHPYGGEGGHFKPLHIMNGNSGTISFDNIPITDQPYYIFETDEDGNVIRYLEQQGGENGFYCMAGEVLGAEGHDKAPVIIMADEPASVGSAVISNVYTGDLPDGYYYTGKITLTKSVMDSGNMITSDDTFYAGIFTVDAQGNVADNPTDVVKLNNNGTVTVEVPLGGTSGTEQITYAVMETDENGKPIDKAAFPYTVTGEGNVTLSMDQTTGEVNIVNTLGNNEGYYQEEPSTQEPAAANPGSGNGNNSNSSSGSSGSGSSSRSSRSAKTGDNNQILLYAGLLAAAVIAGGVVVVRRRRRNG